ncbi:15471_t:CDS:2 [Gigaspora rosea]|nr:15471_t:CDS:2 [Gigaspora rosea]
MPSSNSSESPPRVRLPSPPRVRLPFPPRVRRLVFACCCRPVFVRRHYALSRAHGTFLLILHQIPPASTLSPALQPQHYPHNSHSTPTAFQLQRDFPSTQGFLPPTRLFPPQQCFSLQQSSSS